MSKASNGKGGAPAACQCPCCGHTSRSRHSMSCQLANGTYYEGPWVECDGCGIQGPLKAWRNRAPNAEVSEVAVADSTKTSGIRPPLSLD